VVDSGGENLRKWTDVWKTRDGLQFATCRQEHKLALLFRALTVNTHKYCSTVLKRADVFDSGSIYYKPGLSDVESCGRIFCRLRWDNYKGCLYISVVPVCLWQRRQWTALCSVQKIRSSTFDNDCHGNVSGHNNLQWKFASTLVLCKLLGSHGRLVIIAFAIGPKIRGFKRGRLRWILRGDKNP
jgi:hypothetical protein